MRSFALQQIECQGERTSTWWRAAQDFELDSRFRMDWCSRLSPGGFDRGHLDRAFARQPRSGSLDSLGSGRNGCRFVGDVVLSGRQMATPEYQGGANPISPRASGITSSFHLVAFGGRSVNLLFSGILDRHVPHVQDPR